METSGLEDTTKHFLPCHKSWEQYERIWCIFRKGREVRSWMDYVLRNYSCLSQNVSLWYPLHKYYHYIVLG